MTKPDEPNDKVVQFPTAKARPAEREIEHFEIIPVSQTSPDGSICLFQAKRPDGTDVWLSFSYRDLAFLVENAAREMGRAMRQSGKIDRGFACSGFHIAQEENGGAIALTLFTAGITEEEDGQLSFLLPEALPGDLILELEEVCQGKPRP